MLPKSTILATLFALPLSHTHPLGFLSKVFFLDQIPADLYSNDTDLVTNKDTVYIRKDISYLDPDNGPSLTCLPNGQVQLGFNDTSALKLDKMAYVEILGHPLIIPHGYDASSCPELANRTIYGPLDYIPLVDQGILEEEDKEAVMVALGLDEVIDNRLTFSFIWVDYHELVGVVGEAPDALYYLAKGVFPWSTKAVEAADEQQVVERDVGEDMPHVVGGKFFDGMFETLFGRIRG